MRLLIRCGVLVFALSLSCLAQSAPPIDRLPADTVFFVAWNGIATLNKARATNALLRLWDDPEFATARQLLLNRAARDAKSTTQKRDQERMAAFLDVAANPFVLGVIGAPDLAAVMAKPAAGGQRPPNGFFVIYDLTGKAEQHQKLLQLWAEDDKEKPVVSSLSFSGVTITKATSTKNDEFSAKVGSYFVSTGSQPVIEQLITRLSAPAATDSVLSSSAWQAAAAQRMPDAFLEVFFKIPDMSKLEIPPAQGMNITAMMKSLHLERMQAFIASASLAGNGVRTRAAAIGDTSPGSLFDLFGASSGEFRTLPLAPAGASYSATRFDFRALYQTIRTAVRSGLGPEQASQFEMLEAAMGMQLGIEIADALQTISGEVATISVGSDTASDSATPASALDPMRDMYAVAIERPDEVLKLVQLMMGKNITNETREGDATVFSITSSYQDEKTGAQRKRFNYLAVSPKLLVIAPRRALLREALARANAQAGPATGGLAGDANFLQARSRLPNSLTAISYSDLSHFPWQPVMDAAIKQANEKEESKLTAAEEASLRALPKVISRYLRMAFGGVWKDRQGIFMESFIE